MLFYLPLEINDFLQQVCSLSKFHGHLFEASSRTFWTEPFLSEFFNIMGDGDSNLLRGGRFLNFFYDRAFFSPHDSWPLPLPCLAGSFPHISSHSCVRRVHEIEAENAPLRGLCPDR
jgi:hypothetical protein